MGLEPPSDFKKRDLIFASCQLCIHRHSTDSLIVEIRSALVLLGTSSKQARTLLEFDWMARGLPDSVPILWFLRRKLAHQPRRAAAQDPSS